MSVVLRVIQQRCALNTHLRPSFNLQGSSWDRRQRRFATHNANPPALTARVRPCDVETLRGSSAHFALYSDQAQQLHVVPADGALRVTLGKAGSDMITVSPVRRAGSVALAPIGLVNLLNPGCAVRSCEVSSADAYTGFSGADSSHSNGGMCRMGIAGCGQFAMYASQRPVSVLLDGREVAFEYEGTTQLLRFSVPYQGVLAQQAEVTWD